ncbi:FAD-dependent oxidoreductase [Marinobacter sp. VGCF2001]|uniref:glycerol-3-phosphate dehydrogenase/oxidase n=1 Tax=Marinobacter sp. VGCF2001 TaxID=3417189 RepID=UPI003CFAD182
MERQQALDSLNGETQSFDVVVIGGGITGAGVAREAAGSGLKTLLVEQKDFAWGSSSRSSKMVHGGLRYLAGGHIGLTRDAVRERERMMHEAPGLVDPLPFLMPHYRGNFPGPGLFQILLALYDRLAGTRSHQKYTQAETLQWIPGLTLDGLRATSRFTDAVTDDARLVQRLIAEASQDGAVCLNYVTATAIDRDNTGAVCGLQLVPEEFTGEHAISVTTRCVINAAGAWADRLQKQSATDSPLTIRPLRGSHLVIPWEKLPVTCAVSLLHPADQRPVFAFPWAGTTVLGTTDLEHQGNLNQEPAITREEVDYLLHIATRLFPGAGIKQANVLSTWAGVRPVVTEGDGKAPSQENREHAIRQDHGLISIAGGKLTTFRPMARQALAMALGDHGKSQLRADQQPVFTPPPHARKPAGLPSLTWNRLGGYYGAGRQALLSEGNSAEIPGTGTLWAELEWACRHEQVQHLDDLMLRRSRLGLILPDGGEPLLPAIRERCQGLLGWDDQHWNREQDRYLAIYRGAYQLPQRGEAHGG